MGDEIPYRIVMGIVAVVQNGLAGRSLRRANPIGTIFQTRQEGLPLTLAMGGLLLVYCVAVLAWLIEPAWIAGSAVPLPPWLRWLGLVPMLPGSLLIVWGARHIGTNYTLSVSTRDGHTLVTTGPYGWVRHPLYSGVLLGAVGAALLTANWLVAASGVGMWVLTASRTRLEEEKLVARFGDAYRDYQRQVGMFVPRPTRRGASGDRWPSARSRRRRRGES